MKFQMSMLPLAQEKPFNLKPCFSIHCDSLVVWINWTIRLMKRSCAWENMLTTVIKFENSFYLPSSWLRLVGFYSMVGGGGICAKYYDVTMMQFEVDFKFMFCSVS